ncbi:MAG: exodeoxyribonuclease V subunit gamma [Saccharospirillum sp.]
MIHTLPGNQLETLIEPLATLLAVPVDNPLEPDVIMVQHQGMQHWLSMKLAEHPGRQISMNLAFPLPVQHFWTLIRTILGPDKVPEQSPWRREVLVWRIDELLASDDLRNDPGFAEPSRYWQNQSPGQQALRRFQLAEQLADLFEQYLMYRPDWMTDWDQGKTQGHDRNAQWQARLWQMLTRDDADHPVALIQQALAHLHAPAQPLPERLFLFGINNLPPIWLDFIHALADAGVQFHIFYLNPSDDYWGDVVSEKQAAKLRAQWVQEATEAPLALEIGNPLIANLGQQGQAFVKLLSEHASIESPVFIEPEGDTLLNRLQRDLLHLRDGREQPCIKPDGVSDHSLTIRSAHSALREVQGLHDWLLHQFNQDETLTPKDVLVMCPNVEDYAPFVEAIFARRFDDLAEEVPPLPCSIADRNLKDADPTVAAFLDLLTLPDARFQVTQVLGWLRVPAIQMQFGLSQDDLDPLARWLENATVHWGLDADHKSRFVHTDVSPYYSWKQGLERLLVGFAWGDRRAIVNNRLLLPEVEGSDAVLLGKLMAFLDTLNQLARDLNTPRSATDWQGFLQDRLRLALFATDAQFEVAHDDLRNAIRDLSQHSRVAGYRHAIPLTVVRHVLQNAVASPASTGRQFLTGQITVCSMVPMRSIPFRVLAILGLNDGEFPRQRPPLGFDLMAQDTPRLGDRSRRGDDRYLFLEALLSARESLYLSYQGRDINTNSERQPSLVLAELMAYLEQASDWRPEQIDRLPLQPFSPGNYQGTWPSFDAHWLRLGQPLPERNQIARLPEPDWPEQLSIDDLLRFAEHPARAFARSRLGLFLDVTDRPELSDAEPFSADHLDRYLLQQALIDARLLPDAPPADQVLQEAQLSGRLPDNPLIAETLQDWQHQADHFADHLGQLGAQQLTLEEAELTLGEMTLSARLPRLGQGDLLFWRLADAKGKDRLRLWLHHLFANCLGECTTWGLFRQPKEDQVYSLELAPLPKTNAERELNAWLATWRRGQCEPLPWHCEIGVTMCQPREKRDYHKGDFDTLWHGDGYYNAGLGADAYLNWFWPEAPEHDPLYEALTALYEPLFERLTQEIIRIE